MLLLAGCGIVEPNTTPKSTFPQTHTQDIFTATVSAKEAVKLVKQQVPHATLLTLKLKKSHHHYRYQIQLRHQQYDYQFTVSATKPIVLDKQQKRLTKQNAHREPLKLTKLKSLPAIKQVAISEINDGRIVSYTLAKRQQITYYDLLIHSRAHHTVRLRIDAQQGNILERQQV
ncbi:hypothetical protein FC24_GL001646 [Loigolactobacillus rennini DSM 20253]|uniref:PepSY domain-containing protein n=2 Tax=Loigolactobacillus rennini TaxID=238013 RepID=A0A0R2CYZ2_9LACO|nr:hypothetical protein FC24_GL001646 [Loigolactobacillus rennini DSM 20253]